MTLQELYDRIDGDYAEAIGRLRMDRLIDRFIIRFLDDKTCPSICSSWAAGDKHATFEAAHAAKGVCANLSLTKLAQIASQITEALRPGNEELEASTDVDALVDELATRHQATVDLIRAYADGR